MYRYLPAVMTILISMAISSVVLAQCCSVPNGDPYMDNMITWNGIDVIDEEIIYNGTLFIEGHMRIINSTITMEGKGFVLNSTGSLEVINSKITSGRSDHGFYLDLFGPTSFTNTTLQGCIDLDNGYFGIYVEGDNFHGKDLTMTRSGMIRLDNGDLELDRSSINGIMSYSGNATLKNTMVDLTGITQLGPGTIDLSNVTVTSNMSYSQTAGISSMSGGSLHLDDVVITGSFNAGISAVSSNVWVNNTLIDLQRQIFGFRGTDTMITRASGITILGTETGIELFNCSLDSPITGSHIDTSYFGLSFQGNNPIELVSTEIHDASYGITTNAPITLTDISIHNTQVGLLIEDNSMVEMLNCSFIGFGQWAIEDETWEPRFFPGNEFIPSNTSLGTVAWWGWITLEILGPDGFEVSGAEVIIKSSFGSIFKVQGPDVGVIWGYGNDSGEQLPVTYSVHSKWGTASKEIDFIPKEGKDIEVVLPLTDVKITNIEYKDNSAMISIQCNGSAARDVYVEVYVDGMIWGMDTTTITEGEEKTITIGSKDIEPGDHEIKAEISSNDEYSGTGGYLQENNDLSLQINVKSGKDDGMLNLLLLGLIAASIAILIVIIMLPKRD